MGSAIPHVGKIDLHLGFKKIFFKSVTYDETPFLQDLSSLF